MDSKPRAGVEFALAPLIVLVVYKLAASAISGRLHHWNVEAVLKFMEQILGR